MPPRKQRPAGAPPAESWVPPDWELADGGALQALQRGDASPDMQRRALKFVIERLANTYDMSYRPTGDRDTCFAEGRRFVGLQIVKILNYNLARFRKAEPGEQPQPGEQG